jgi:hypothetical protein
MLLLVSGATKTVRNTPGVGCLIVPGAGGLPIPDRPWAMDNGAFSGFDEPKFLRKLDLVKDCPGCLWVACPDVVADHIKTLRLFDEWEPRIREIGLPVALVAQDGLISCAVPWDRIDALFIGGTTEWKIGEEARTLVLEAKRRGKLVHMGRVNTARRITTALDWGVDTIDGTSMSMYPDTYIPKHMGTIETVKNFFSTNRRLF